ncbi:DUF202 domain-containing protein [Fulvivirga sp. M361]|uniref:DUF202 domain-containing protein n=1 Tax=Fulvivirga sp. M361 TaxID=2594266 RepID=UPI00117B1CF3|nr:DUF202 domain-containing protein [Fulvivirga sp. M361]TRX59360.1 DUF202 domain-containing protein [Fulvivirga sp. M361]
MEHYEISKTDLLAIERTRLANERTSLAYFRSFIVFLSSGFVILKIEVLSNLQVLGISFIVIAFIFLIVGIARFLYVKKKIKKFYKYK